MIKLIYLFFLFLILVKIYIYIWKKVSSTPILYLLNLFFGNVNNFEREGKKSRIMSDTKELKV